ncbi:MAG TPA: YtzC family protein [Pseudobacillus sp.]
MATRQSVDECLEQCQSAINYAEQQYNEAARQVHNNAGDFSQSQLMLESAYNDLDKLLLSANEQQREMLHRMRLQLQQMQNSMILLDR